MISLQSAVVTLPGYAVYFGATILTAAQLTVFLAFLRTKQGGALVGTALVHLLTGLFFLTVLLDYSYNDLIIGLPEVLYGFERWLLSVPWLFYIGAELVSAAVIWSHVRSLRKYRNTYLSADAIRQTVNLLPMALMISDPDGTVLLANLKMTELCQVLTGEILSDAHRFRQRAEGASEGDHLVHTPAGETWQFTQSRITLNGREYDQLTAADMTAKYRMIRELRSKNERLRKVQYRMRTVAAKERSLVAAREIMNARMTVHDRMGSVLLSGKYYLDHPEDVKEEELLRLLEYNNSFLLGEAEQPDREGDLMEEALGMARRIGISVEISGTLPEAEPARTLIAQAIDQCSANTVRHAEGDRLAVVITENETKVTAAFSNNGHIPKGPIAETGGLAVLRKAVEDAGGTMNVQNEPRFLLRISVLK